MKISYNWLKEYLECDLSPEAVSQALTSIGLEVDSLEQIEEIPGGLAGVIVAEVVECVEHPDSDHLTLQSLIQATLSFFRSYVALLTLRQDRRFFSLL